MKLAGINHASKYWTMGYISQVHYTNSGTFLPWQVHLASGEVGMCRTKVPPLVKWICRIQLPAFALVYLVLVSEWKFGIDCTHNWQPTHIYMLVKQRREFYHNHLWPIPGSLYSAANLRQTVWIAHNEYYLKGKSWTSCAHKTKTGMIVPLKTLVLRLSFNFISRVGNLVH